MSFDILTRIAKRSKIWVNSPPIDEIPMITQNLLIFSPRLSEFEISNYVFSNIKLKAMIASDQILM